MIHDDRVDISLNPAAIPSALGVKEPDQSTTNHPGQITLSVEAQLKRSGKGKRLIVENGSAPESNNGIVNLLKEAFNIRAKLLSGTSDDSIEAMSQRLGINKHRLTNLIRLSYLSPQIIRSLFEGRHPIELTPTLLLKMSKDLPNDWREQGPYLGVSV